MHNPICSCIFIKMPQTKFKIIVVYVDDLNLVQTFEKFIETLKYLKKDLKWKFLDKQNFVSIYKSSIFQLECRFINQHELRKP